MLGTAVVPSRLLPAAWIYDRDPFQPLKWQDDLEKFKARLGAGEDVFGPLIRKYLLDNGHRVTVELRPDSSLGDKIEQTEQERLQVRPRPAALLQHSCWGEMPNKRLAYTQHSVCLHGVCPARIGIH